MFVLDKPVNTKDWPEYKDLRCVCGSFLFNLRISGNGSARLACYHCSRIPSSGGMGNALSAVTESLLFCFKSKKDKARQARETTSGRVKVSNNSG